MEKKPFLTPDKIFNEFFEISSFSSFLLVNELHAQLAIWIYITMFRIIYLKGKT